MEKLSKQYKDKLEAIKSSIQESDELAAYLDSETDEDYAALKTAFEGSIEEIHVEIAKEHPLQLVSFERELLDDGFEGLFLQRILGYAVLRGVIDENYKYLFPQSHFKDILLAIIGSANFDVLMHKIGQSIQIGFALSSDIWITNIIQSITNKRVISFLESQKVDRYRDIDNRRFAYRRYKKQFENFYSLFMRIFNISH